MNDQPPDDRSCAISCRRALPIGEDEKLALLHGEFDVDRRDFQAALTEFAFLHCPCSCGFARYNQIYDQYKKAPGVTRERMYLETMEKVLGPMDKTVVDSNSASPPVPYIALEPLSKTTGAAK